MENIDNNKNFDNIKKHLNFFFFQKNKMEIFFRKFCIFFELKKRKKSFCKTIFSFYISFILLFYCAGLILSFVFTRAILFIKKEKKITAVMFVMFFTFFYTGMLVFFLGATNFFLAIYMEEKFFSFKFSQKMDIIKLPTLLRCKLLLVINLAVFVCYKFLLYFDFIFDYLDVRIILFMSFCWSVHKCYKDIVEYMLHFNPDALFSFMKKLDKILRFFIYNTSLTSSLVITGGRLLGQLIIESISLRYGVSGFMLMGGSGIIQSTCETAEQHAETVKTFGASPYPIVIHTEPLPEVPSVPPKNVCKFIATVSNHAIDLNSSPHEEAYERRFNMFKENNFFKKRFGEDWKEFKSCIRGIILDAKHTGEVDYNIMITEKQVADFINTKGRPVQVKTKVFVTTAEIEEILKNQRVKEAIERDNMLLHFFLERGVKGDIGSIQNTVKPYILKKNVILTNLITAPRVSAQDAEDVLLYPKYNKNYVKECNSLMRVGGYQKCASYMAEIKKMTPRKF